MSKEYVSAITASVILGVSVKQLYNYLDAKKLTRYTDPRTGRARLLKSEVEAFVDPKPIKN